ncbi:DNA invertase Pin-like site-specific DNA recombinase [Bradyrhizobium sp. LB1.3]
MESAASQRDDFAICRMIAGLCVELARFCRGQAFLEMLQQQGFLSSGTHDEDRFTILQHLVNPRKESRILDRLAGADGVGLVMQMPERRAGNVRIAAGQAQDASEGNLPAVLERRRRRSPASLILTVQGSQAKKRFPWFPCMARLVILYRVRKFVMARKNLQVSEAPENAARPRPRNVLIYIRVSTEKQSNNQLSLDSQEDNLITRCKRDGDNIVGIFREEGETATNMKRPAFEQMIARATDGTRAVDAIMVYSFSRAFRNQVEQELTVQTLRKHKVELISHAEPLANDDTGDMFRKFIGIVNEYQSKETARSTMRTMKANAQLGYSNGGIIPFGYKSIDAEVIGNKQKKKLAIEPVEAEIVIRAFDLAKNGDGNSGPLGTKKIAEWLNARGYRSRNGSLFGTGTIHEILTRRAYSGVRTFNEFDRKGNGERKAQSEIVEYEIPVIIDQSTFEAVQALLESRRPRSRGPRLASAPSLLGGLVRCDCAKSCALTTATGTSRTGVIYSYYKCIQSIKKGAAQAR